MKFMLGCAIVALSVLSTTANPVSYIPYAFGYSTADGMSRQEQGSNGVVTGSYSYTDANGDLRQVKYTADAHGFRPEGDISVDRKTASAAAALAALAPKASVAPFAPAWSVPVASAPVAPTYKSFNSFEKLMQAPLSLPTWSHSPAPVAYGAPVSYQVDTPTHKIWVKY